MEYWNLAILVGALLLLVSIVASDISSRMGAPLLLGDRLRLGGAELVVREIEDGKVTRIGLRVR